MHIHSQAKMLKTIAELAGISISLTKKVSIIPHRLASLYSPPKATTVLMDESTSSATAPADTYSSCSRLAKAVLIWGLLYPVVKMLSKPGTIIYYLHAQLCIS